MCAYLGEENRAENITTAVSMNVDLEHVPGQIGTAVVDLISGSIVQSSGDLSGDNGNLQCEKLYQMMKVFFSQVRFFALMTK